MALKVIQVNWLNCRWPPVPARQTGKTGSPRENRPPGLFLSCPIIVVIVHTKSSVGPHVPQGTRRQTLRLRLSAILESDLGKFHPNQPCAHPSTCAIVGVSLSKGQLYRGRMPRSLRRIPDYFTEEEAGALVNAAPSYPARMAFRIMLKTGLRVSEALALRRVDLRLEQEPPIIVVAADSPGNKGRKGREVPVPADLVESLRDLASSHSKNHYQPMLNLSRQRIGQVMKDAAREVGIDPARAHPHAFRHTYGRNCVLRGVPIPVLQKWLGHASMVDTQRYVELAGAHHEWVSRL